MSALVPRTGRQLEVWNVSLTGYVTLNAVGKDGDEMLRYLSGTLVLQVTRVSPGQQYTLQSLIHTQQIQSLL